MSEPRRRKPSAQSNARQRKAPARQAARRRPAPDRDFWGSAQPEADPVEVIRPAEDPTAMVVSLGRPPLPGAETIAEHYFAAVYERAAALAVALAAASDVLDVSEQDD
jgi:hypothetical protein